MLTSSDHAIFGVTNLEAAVGFMREIGFVVDDIEAAAASLGGASVAAPVRVDCPPYGGVRAWAGVCPAGVPFELWQGLRPTAG